MKDQSNYTDIYEKLSVVLNGWCDETYSSPEASGQPLHLFWKG
jgi:hypothetical protein